ncbi:PQQ-dependent sugar dehydrogenase [Halomonas sp. McH1-25]|uniref:PQQ-dependent sugar dehydrogenase n=1 Tax=unclassified Halomonas TaxID=2609666 RepID=UPI001EF74013|nr:MULTISPECIES: PQQ-dependent sugar dehydrogenase [unclassified Halomonas]MCG7600514.1 PQQ-dependent sugar dehydrogenase [Halomonas sp. McH1-25]MCP1343574.1 PQQ-dependent sugar dehydrogenase [Halomonas sp. FL8]MCP1360021.1 PQQ-dependent sugar dehydrogenase [Halomonas sp. BBD45]MCP1365739.1 PQQ-dependent sugar dehydrogenase [Halomonas sp. BBD48]
MPLRRPRAIRVTSTWTAAGLLGAMLALPSAGLAQSDTLHPVDVAGTEHRLNVPGDVQVEKVTALDAPRMISIGPGGEMFIGSNASKIYRLAPPYDQAETLAEFDAYPNSVVQRGDYLYVATTAALLRAPYATGQSLSRSDFSVYAELPGGGGHDTRTLTVGPDDRLYVSLGIQGNCSDQYIGEGYDFEDRRGGILVLDENGDSPQWQAYASGLRNPVGLAWDDTGTLYAINNGPDHWGYEAPGEVLVRAERGSFHGMPWFQWVDGEFQRDDCIASEPPRPASEIPEPVATLPARSAPLGLDFLPEGSMLPLDAVTAVHGSWGTQPDGSAAGDPSTRREPRIAGIVIDAQGNGQVSDLITGFQDDRGNRWARPAGIAFGPDRALYFTSNSGETGLYRVTFGGGPVGAEPRLLDTATGTNTGQDKAPSS